MNEFIHYYPSGRLLIAVLLLIVIDLITGITKATINKQRRTSEGLRRTFSKFMQYGGSIIVSMILLNIIHHSTPEFSSEISRLFGSLMLMIMIYIEVVSVFENLEEINPKSDFVRYFIKPVRRLLTFRIKNLFGEDNR